MWTIVPYSPAHRDGVVAVVKGVFDEYGFTWEADGYCADLYDVDGAYLSRGCDFFCAVEDDRVIGCAGVSFQGDHAELHRMYLDQRCRGRGIGRALLDACLGAARAHGCRAMRAWSDVKLADAHHLYRKSGFVKNGDRICDDPDNSPEFGFWKEPL